MLSDVVWFELKYHARRVSTYACVLIWFLLPLPNVGTEGTTTLLANSPSEIAHDLAQYVGFGFIVIAAIFGAAVQRDFALETYQVLLSTPVTRGAYLGGRFLASAIVCLAVFAASALGHLYAASPWVAHPTMVPIHVWNYVWPFLVFAVPAVFFAGSVFFAIGALTRSTAVVYLQGVAFFAIYMVLVAIARVAPDASWPAILDPFGLSALTRATEHWPLALRNHSLPPLTGVLLWNRLLWCAAGAMVLAFVFLRFRLSGGKAGAVPRLSQDVRPVEPEITSPAKLPGTRIDRWQPVRQWGSLVRLHIRSTLSDLPFLAIVIIGIAVTWVMSWGARQMFGNVTVYPATSLLLGRFSEFANFIAIITVVYAGELVWKSRAVRFDQVEDSLPTSGAVRFASHLTTLAGIQLLLLAVAVIINVIDQVLQGYYAFEFGLSARAVLGVTLPVLILYAIASLWIHTIAPHKFIGHAVIIAMVLGGLGVLGWERSPFVEFARTPNAVYSDMNGYEPYWRPHAWFMLYWIACAVFLAVWTVVAARRGTEMSWRARLRQARQRVTPATVAAGLLSLAAFAGLGAFLFHTTHVVNRAESMEAAESRAANYERRFKQFENLVQPRIVSVELDVDLFPQQRRFQASGTYVLANDSSTSIDAIHVVDANEALTTIDLDAGCTAWETGEDARYRICRLAHPLAPNATVRLRFNTAFAARGFTDGAQQTDITANGTVLSRDWFPHIGYQRTLEIPYEVPRRRNGLLPRKDLPPATTVEGQRQSMTATDGDWVQFKARVSTESDQVVVAPGAATDSTEGGRRTFWFDTGSARVPSTYAIVSARYGVERQVAGATVVEVYFNPNGIRNTQGVARVAARTLEYLASTFGPPPSPALRFIEVPRYPRSVSMGFTSFENEGGRLISRPVPAMSDDPLLFPVALDVAQRWWQGQLAVANAEGGLLVVDALAKYSALSLVEEVSGAAEVRRLLANDRSGYLQGRSRERIGEPPLARVVPRSQYVLRKTAPAMYAMKTAIGDTIMADALRRFLDRARFRDAPFATAAELIDAIRLAARPEHRHLIDDWFESITFLDTRVVAATSVPLPGGRFAVTIDVAAQKTRADGRGVEQAAAVNDDVDIVVFGADSAVPLLTARHRLSQAQSRIEVTVQGAPVRVGVDPYLINIDRTPENNVARVR